mgnify:CR=1 FL=1
MAGRTDAGTDQAFPFRWVTVLAVAFGLAATLMSAWRASETPDEPVHLEWSRRLLLERVTERRSNEYFESKSPVSMLNVVARAPGPARGRRRRRAAARMCAPFRLAPAHRLSRHPARGRCSWPPGLAGPTAAHLATIACALDPNLIAHGGLATVDVAFALFHFLALAAAYASRRNPRPRAA